MISSSLLLLVATAQAIDLEVVEQSLLEYAMERCDAVEVEVAWSGLSPHLPGGSELDLKWDGDPCRSRPSLRLLAVENGEMLGRWSVRPHLRVWVEQPVAAGLTMAGDLIEVLPGHVLVDSIVGRSLSPDTVLQARVRIEPGEPVTDAVAEPVPDVFSGAKVMVRVRRGPLVVTAPGTLMQDAAMGDVVRVTNNATRVVLKGTLSRADIVDLP
ncbi:MAG: flagella basal body P-ring formation protein FlgA [Myxococcota bacterium]|nr:flagella basal body P-ring formation protein FlgA [Myxococcota bacterium]